MLKEQSGSADDDSDESMTIKLSEVDDKEGSFFNNKMQSKKGSNVREGTAKFKKEDESQRNESIDTYLETNQSIAFDKQGMNEEELRHYENKEQLGMYMREH